MYLPEKFRPSQIDFTRKLIEKVVLGSLITVDGTGKTIVTLLPFLCETTNPRSNTSTSLTLLSHLARDNAHCKLLEQAQTISIIFLGPHTYVSPQWYVSPVNAPTWNYTLSVVHGTPELISDRHELLPLMEKLVRNFEERYAEPAGINLQPERLERLLGRIIGLRVNVTSIDEKAQLNQNRSLDDQRAVAEKLFAYGGENAVEIANLMRHEIDNAEKILDQVTSTSSLS